MEPTSSFEIPNTTAISNDSGVEITSSDLEFSPNILRPSILREIIRSPANFTSTPSSPHSSRFLHLFAHSKVEYPPLPRKMRNLADAEEIWKSLFKKESSYPRDHKYLRRHLEIEWKMRSLLIDWMMEVCDEKKMKRVTFYLACDLLDRYLTMTSDHKKSRLQLIGVTSLFIASKAEEIYPPKIAEFADLTDGACDCKQIIDQELLMLNALNWLLTPVTPIMWLQLYVQLHTVETSEHADITLNSDFALLIGDRSQRKLLRIVQLLDLAILDIRHLKFRPSVIAASVIYLTLDVCDITSISGYQYSQIEECVKWMTPMKLAYIEGNLQSQLGGFHQDLTLDELCSNQLHNQNLHHFDRSLSYRDSKFMSSHDQMGLHCSENLPEDQMVCQYLEEPSEYQMGLEYTENLSEDSEEPSQDSEEPSQDSGKPSQVSEDQMILQYSEDSQEPSQESEKQSQDSAISSQDQIILQRLKKTPEDQMDFQSQENLLQRSLPFRHSDYNFPPSNELVFEHPTHFE